MNPWISFRIKMSLVASLRSPLRLAPSMARLMSGERFGHSNGDSGWRLRYMYITYCSNYILCTAEHKAQIKYYGTGGRKMGLAWEERTLDLALRLKYENDKICTSATQNCLDRISNVSF